MNLKRLLHLSILFLITVPAYAQQWQWANANGASGSVDRNVVMTRDNAGNLILSGEFESTCNFGSYTLTPIGSRDIFVAKYDSSGTCLWAVQGGGTFSTNESVGIATDNSGNIWIAGNFSTVITFGGYTLNQTSNPFNVNPYNSFITKFDPNGNCVYSKAIFSKTVNVIRALKGDGNGNFFITGAYMDSTLFDALPTTSNNPDIFLTKFDSQGNFIWVKSYGGVDEDGGFDLAITASGSIYMTGTFKLTGTFGSNSVISYGDFDIFIAKFDNAGNNLWVQSAGATGGDQAYSISCDNIGNAFITGYYYPTPSGMTTLPAHFGPFLLPDNGAGNMFIAKYDTIGIIQWAKHGGGTQHDEGLNVHADANGNAYVTGFFHSQTATTGPASFSGVNLYSSGVADAFVVKFNKYGTGLFGQKIGGTGIDKGRSILSYPNGDLVVAGNFTSTVTVNTTPPTPLAAVGFQWRMFIAKYSGGSVGNAENASVSNSLSLFPNPANEKLTLSLHNESPENYRFDFINHLGQVCRSYQNQSAAGLNDFIFDTSALPSGNYILRLSNEKTVLHRPFIIQD